MTSSSQSQITIKRGLEELNKMDSELEEAIIENLALKLSQIIPEAGYRVAYSLARETMECTREVAFIERSEDYNQQLKGGSKD
jgi:hypothetical protein